jgi:hypothetical protein
MASNVVAHTDVKDNIYPRKERPENKIDGIVALIMALSRRSNRAESVVLGSRLRIDGALTSWEFLSFFDRFRASRIRAQSDRSPWGTFGSSRSRPKHLAACACLGRLRPCAWLQSYGLRAHPLGDHGVATLGGLSATRGRRQGPGDRTTGSTGCWPNGPTVTKTPSSGAKCCRVIWL